MKVPGADYTQLRQAIGARTSARMASISAKDATSSQKRYEIQQQSIDLQRSSNNLNAVANLAQSGLNFAQAVYSNAQSSDNNRISLASSRAGAAVDRFIAENGKDLLDYNTNEWLPDAEEQLDELIGQHLGTEGDYRLSESWEKVQSLKESLKDQAMATVLKTIPSQLKEESMNALDISVGENTREWSTIQWPEGSDVDVWFDNTSGTLMNGDAPEGTGTIKVPAFLWGQISGVGNLSDAEKYTLLSKYSQNAVAQRGSVMAMEFTRRVAEGSFASDEERWNAWDEMISFAETWVPDDGSREEWIDTLKTQNTDAIGKYFDSLILKGNDNREPGAEQVKTIYENFNPGEGKDPKASSYYGMFFDKDGNPMCTDGTFAAEQSRFYNLWQTAESNYGATATAAVQAVVNECIAGLTSGEMNYTTASAKLLTVLDANYENQSWMTDPEVQGILTNYFTKAAGDLSKNEQVQAYINLSVANALELGDVSNFNDLSLEQKAIAADIEAMFISELTRVFAVDPTKAADPGEMVNALKRVNAIYSHEWYTKVYSPDFNYADTSDVSLEEGADAVDKAEEMIVSLFTQGSENADVVLNYRDLIPAEGEDGKLANDGWVEGKDIRLAAGSSTNFQDGMNRIKQYLEMKTGTELDRGFEIQFGKVDGKVTPVAVRFPHEDDHTQLEVYKLDAFYSQDDVPEAIKDPEEVAEELDDINGAQASEAFLKLSEGAQAIVGKYSGTPNTNAAAMLSEAGDEETLNELWDYLEESGAYVSYQAIKEAYDTRLEEIRNPAVDEEEDPRYTKEAVEEQKDRELAAKLENYEKQYGKGFVNSVDSMNNARSLDELKKVLEESLQAYASSDDARRTLNALYKTIMKKNGWKENA